MSDEKDTAARGRRNVLFVLCVLIIVPFFGVVLLVASVCPETTPALRTEWFRGLKSA